jgi:hypothetical protein
MALESRLSPILREGIEVIKMIFFKRVKIHLLEKYPEREMQFVNRLTGAVTNKLFGTPNEEEPFYSFAREQAGVIEQELKNVAGELEEMRIPLTDALRIQFLCDSLDGIDSSPVLAYARDIGVLIEERDVPLPDQFMNLVRRLGESFRVLQQIKMGSA